MLKVFRVCPVYAPDFKHGGSVVADYELDKAMVKSGFDVSVVTTSDMRANLGSKDLGGVLVAAYYSKWPLYACSISAVAISIVRIIKQKRDIDLVWIGGVWNMFALLIPLVCRWFKVKYCISTHGMLVPSLIDKKSKWQKRIMMRLFLSRAMSCAHFVHCTVQSECNDVYESLGFRPRFLVMPLFFDFSRFDLAADLESIQNQKLIIGFVGRVTEKKRVDLLFQAIHRLSSKDRDAIRVVIAGTDVDCQIEKLRREFPDCHEIRYVGEMYGDELVRLYHSLDVFVLPSESENFAISVVEAAYCSTALVLSEKVGVASYFKDGESMMLTSLDPECIAKCFSELVSDPLLVERLKVGAKKISAQFSHHFFSRELLLEMIGEK